MVRMFDTSASHCLLNTSETLYVIIIIIITTTTQRLMCHMSVIEDELQACYTAETVQSVCVPIRRSSLVTVLIQKIH